MKMIRPRIMRIMMIVSNISRLQHILYGMPGYTSIHDASMQRSHPSVKSVVLFKCAAPVYMATGLLCLL
jgi:hypothetical protein